MRERTKEKTRERTRKRKRKRARERTRGRETSQPSFASNHCPVKVREPAWCRVWVYRLGCRV
jgi:hypothetical protein